MIANNLIRQYDPRKRETAKGIYLFYFILFLQISKAIARKCNNKMNMRKNKPL